MRWQREFLQMRENQASPDEDLGLGILKQQSDATAQMLSTPIGEPPLGFSVRCIYDSRLPNSYDFNFSTSGVIAVSTNVVTVPFAFSSPPGYRAVPRKWHVFFDSGPTGPASNTTMTLLNNNNPVPNNVGIIIGVGTGPNPIESFFVVEENTTFGAAVTVSLLTTSGTFVTYVNVYGNLLPVTEVALPLAVTNKDSP